MSANSTPIQTPGLSFHLEDFPTTRLRTPGIKTTPFVTISPSFSSLPADDLERQEPASTGGADQHDQLLPGAIPPKDTNWATSKAKRVRANVRELRKSRFGSESCFAVTYPTYKFSQLWSAFPIFVIDCRRNGLSQHRPDRNHRCLRLDEQILDRCCTSSSLRRNDHTPARMDVSST